MNEAFEKIIERLEKRHTEEYNKLTHELNKNGHTEYYNTLYGKCGALQDAISEVYGVLEEYNGGWIACSERLPEKNGMYLCTQNTYDLVTNKKIIRVSTELVEFYNGKWRRAKNLVVTHWRPLPEPYNERD